MMVSESESKYFVTLSKEEWSNIGLVHGWPLKTAMPVRIRDEVDRIDMAKEGIFVLENAFKSIPGVTQKQVKQLLDEMKAAGTSEFFETLDAKTAIQLPAIYVAKPSSLVEIDGSQYYIISVDISRETKQKQTQTIVENGRMVQREFQKGGHYPGLIIAMDVETGKPVPFGYDEVVGKIRTPSANKEETLRRINDEIAAWNERVATIEKAAGVTKLALQIRWAEEHIQERIATLNTQITELEAKMVDPLEGHPAYANWLQFLREGVRTGQFDLQDTFDALLYLYQAQPQDLVTGIQDGSIGVPNELKDGLLGLAAQKAMSQEAEKKKVVDKEKSKQERMEQELLPERDVAETVLEPLMIEDIPNSEYKKLNQNKTLHSCGASLKEAIKSIKENKTELQRILDSFVGVRSYIGALEKGQRSNSYLQSDDGAETLSKLEEFLYAASEFIKKYEVDIIINGKINSKLMGREGTVGNALLAVVIQRIYNIVRRTLRDAMGQVITEPETTPREVPVDEDLEKLRNMVSSNKFNLLKHSHEYEKEPVDEGVGASSKNKIKRMSELLWIPFKERMRLK